MAALRKASPRRKIAARIRSSRLAVGISQEVAARQLRVHRDQWYRIEAGLQSLPSERLKDVARIVKRPVLELLGEVT
jgi:transcriptional regulator with XRE-family HTH domain